MGTQTVHTHFIFSSNRPPELTSGLPRTPQDSPGLCRFLQESQCPSRTLESSAGLNPAAGGSAPRCSWFPGSGGAMMLLLFEVKEERVTEGGQMETAGKNLLSAPDEELTARLATNHKLFTSPPKQTRKELPRSPRAGQTSS